MALRKDLPRIIILATHFHKFDRGQEIEQIVPIHWNMKPGDTIEWECAQYGGRAEIISCKKKGRSHTCVIKKLS